MSDEPTSSVALYLHDGHPDPVFGILHEPPGGVRGDTAVLICPPFGWDETCSYRSRRDWALHLAEEGFPALRIDLPGTGDSGGSPHDDGRLASWTDAVAAAAAELRARTGCTRIAAIGIGLGGLLICDAIADGTAIDDVVLWAVPGRGRTLLRELRTFASLEESELEPAPEEAFSSSATVDGEVWVGGFVLTADTAAALERLDVEQMELSGGLPRRALLLGRDGIAVDKRLRERLERAGASVALSDGDGYGEMMARPHDAISPIGVFAEVAQWLKAGTEGTRSAANAASAGTPRTTDSIEIDVDGERIRETPIAIALPFGDEFGVIAEPVDGVQGDVCAVLLNAGAIRRIGPNRMWVETARRWSALGLPTVRLDVEGIGDADGESSAFGEMAGLYVPELVAQVRGALDGLVARGYGPRFILAGLCSGAYWAFHAALEDERVVAAYMLNSRVLYWDPTLDVQREVRKALAQTSAWRRALRGEVPLRRLAAVVYHLPAALLRRAVRRLAQLFAQRHGGDRLDRAFDQLRDEGKHLVLMFSDNEPLYEELELEGRLKRLARWPNVVVEKIAGGIHTLRPAEAQQSAHEALDRALEDDLRRTPAGSLSEAS